MSESVQTLARRKWPPARISIRDALRITLISLALFLLSPPARAEMNSAGVNETPYQADAFVDSMGVNVCFNAGCSVGDADTIKGLEALGIRHVRNDYSTDPRYLKDMQTIGQAGIRLDVIMHPGMTAAQIREFPALVSPALEAYEGPNETGSRWGRQWVGTTRTFMQLLYANKGPYTVYGPTLYAQAAAVVVGDISAHMDYGNIHPYIPPFWPGIVTGWGGYAKECGTRFQANVINFIESCEIPMSGPGTFVESPSLKGMYRFIPDKGSKPIVATETGYGTAYQQLPGIFKNELDFATQAKYISRLYFDYYMAGIARTYVFTYEDWPCTEKHFDSCYGLVNGYNYKKPAYYAVQGLIAALSDPGPSFPTTPLAYTISNSPETLAHMLFQKRNGEYTLALWNETASWNGAAGAHCPGKPPVCGAPVKVAPVPVTVTLPFSPLSLAVRSFDDEGKLRAIPAAANGKSVTVDVDDHVSLLNFRRETN